MRPPDVPEEAIDEVAEKEEPSPTAGLPPWLEAVDPTAEDWFEKTKDPPEAEAEAGISVAPDVCWDAEAVGAVPLPKGAAPETGGGWVEE